MRKQLGGGKRHFVFASEGMPEKNCGNKGKIVCWIKDRVLKEKGPVEFVVIVRIFIILIVSHTFLHVWLV